MNTDANHFKFDCPQCEQSIECPNELYDSSLPCPSCQQLVLARQPDLPPVVRPHLNSGEPVYFRDNFIQVTKSRCVLGEQIFAMSGITSVRAVKYPTNRTGSVWLFIASAFSALLMVASYAAGSKVVPLFFFLVCLASSAWGVHRWCQEKPLFAAFISTAGGEVRAYTSYDPLTIQQIIGALNRAIVERG